ncbi:LysR substrate-binding domain-containing protein [Sphingomonas sp. RS6]
MAIVNEGVMRGRGRRSPAEPGLTVGCFASIGRRRLADALLQLARRHPEIALGVHEAARTQLLPAVATGMLQFVIVPGVERDDHPSAPLWTDHVVVAMSRRHPLAAHERIRVVDLDQARMQMPVSRHHRDGEVHRFLSYCVRPLGPVIGGPLVDLPMARILERIAEGDGAALVCGSDVDDLDDRIVVREIDAAGAAFPVRGYWRDGEPGEAVAGLVAALQRPTRIANA